MDGSLGDNVGVQAVAEVDRVDVVAGAELACAQQNAEDEMAQYAMPHRTP